jgi:tyrosine aminotransferase
MNSQAKIDVNNNSTEETATTPMINGGLLNHKAMVNSAGRVGHELDAGRSEWNIDASQFAKHTSNPVRKMIEQMKIECNPDLPMIALSIGDPTVFSHLGKPGEVTSAMESCLKEKKYDGYTPSYGTESARAALARYCSRPDDLVYKFSDIILTNGCSHAIDLCITVLANPGQNILIPKPGFSIYKTLSGTLGIDVKYYSLLVSLHIVMAQIARKETRKT